MEYLGLTEDDMLDVIITVEKEMEREKESYNTRLRELGLSQEQMNERLAHFENTYFVRKIIAENNRRLVDEMAEQFNQKKRDMFI